MPEHFHCIENNARRTENDGSGPAHSAHTRTWELILLVCHMRPLPCAADGSTSSRRYSPAPGVHNFCLFVPVRRICASSDLDRNILRQPLPGHDAGQQRALPTPANNPPPNTACKHRGLISSPDILTRPARFKLCSRHTSSTCGGTPV